MESLGIGGAEKSLVTLLSQFDYSKYDVDLFLFDPKGEFMELLPSEVNLVYPSEDFKNYISSPKNSMTYLYKHRKIKLLMYKIIENIILSINKYMFHKEYIGWRYIKQSVDILPKEYDVAIGFLEKKSIYFTVDKVKSQKKIGWIHIDYEKIEHDHKMDYKYFGKLDNIITVSSHCKEVLDIEFPKYKDRISIIENIISPHLIRNMANKEVEDLQYISKHPLICTVCRLTVQKGVDIAIECCEQLVKKGLIFKWIIVGEGSERSRLQQLIEEKKLNDYFELIGSKSNPYPYINQCDIYVQPSRWEGFGITVAEAKVLAKPILAHDIPEFREQITDDETGLLYRDLDDMVKRLEYLISEKSVRRQINCNLMRINMNNNYEMKKVEKLFQIKGE